MSGFQMQGRTGGNHSTIVHVAGSATGNAGVHLGVGMQDHDLIE